MGDAGADAVSTNAILWHMWECVTETAIDRVPQMSSTPPSTKHALHQIRALTITGDLNANYKIFWDW